MIDLIFFITQINNFLFEYFLKNPLFSIGYYFLFDLENHLLCTILNTKVIIFIFN